MPDYRFIPADSRFTVQAFATGLLSALGHNPTFAIRDFAGMLRFDPLVPGETSIELIVTADSLELVDRVKPADREEIETIMRRDVLETQSHPQVKFASTRIAADRVADTWHRLHVTGALTLHGVDRELNLDAQLRTSDGRARLSGDTALKLSDFQLKRVSALAGTIKLKDDLKFSFELMGRPEPG